jgi:DNA-binding transcriptional ArsR family regulator
MATSSTVSITADLNKGRARRRLQDIHMNEDGVFRALADANRHALLERLHRRNGQTLSELCAGLEMTRQAVSKHLLILQNANLIYEFRPELKAEGPTQGTFKLEANGELVKLTHSSVKANSGLIAAVRPGGGRRSSRI